MSYMVGGYNNNNNGVNQNNNGNNNNFNNNNNQQQQHQQQQHNNNGNGNGNGNPESNNGQPDYTLAGILHFLQSEWRRYERDRNEWEIERAEMRARIALLEGERRGVENLKTDLMRRVKMLEYALRQERSKYLSSSSNPISATAKHLSQEKTAANSSSGRSSPSRSEAENDPTKTSTFSTNTLNLNQNPSTFSNTGTFNVSTLGGAQGLSRQPTLAGLGGKDGKSRAKSRDYLKQCLQEISYLTSVTTLNPLPDRIIANPGGMNGSMMGGGNGNQVGGLGLGGTNPNQNLNPNNQNGLNSNVGSMQRPRKVLSENVPPTNTIAVQQHQQQLEQQQQQNSLRKNLNNQHLQQQGQPQVQSQNNDLGLATGAGAGAVAAAGAVGIGTANALKVNNKKDSNLVSKLSNETVPEEENENQGESLPSLTTGENSKEKPNDSFEPLISSNEKTSEISLNDQESLHHPLGGVDESESSEAKDSTNDNHGVDGDGGGGGRPPSPPRNNEMNLISNQSSSDDDGSSSTSTNSSNDSRSHYEDDGIVGSGSGSSSTSEDFEGDQVTAIFRPGGGKSQADQGGNGDLNPNLGDQGDWAKLKEAGLREREKRESERRKREGDASTISDAQAQLALTSERVNQLLSRSPNPSSTGNDGEDELSNLSLPNQEDESSSSTSSKDFIDEQNLDSQLWKSKKVLRSHLDSVRSIVFNPAYNLNNSNSLSLVSASDDNTIKIWKLDPNSFNSNSIKLNSLGGGINSSSSGNSSTGNDVHPFMTLRGHSASITALQISNNCSKLFSASLDSSIKVWKLPKMNNNGSSSSSSSINSNLNGGGNVNNSNGESYQPFDDSLELNTLIGHTQSIWDLTILPNGSNGNHNPSAPTSSSSIEDDGTPSSNSNELLASVSADGTTKIWNVNDRGYELKSSWDYFGNELDQVGLKEKERFQKEKKQKNHQTKVEELEESSSTSSSDESSSSSSFAPIPTSVNACHWNLKTVVVAYSNSIVKLFDIETGKEVLKLNSDETYDGTDATQINKVITHPALPLLITAHEDKYIRMFDLNTGTCTLSMLAHQDAVTSLDIDPAGLTLVSGGHDCSVRFWDIVGTTSNTKGLDLSLQENQNPLLQQQGGGGGGGGSSNGTNSAACVQEITAHRKKATEGVLDVKYHPTAPYFASAGADGVIRIYG